MKKSKEKKVAEVSVVSKESRIYLPDNRYPKELAVMQNRMIEAWSSMTIDEKRIFVLASPLVRLSNVSEQTCFSITAQDYAEACGISVASAYHQLKDASDALRGRYFSYINTKQKRVSVHWVIRIEYSEAEISFYFPDEVLYMLSMFNEDNPYTKFKIGIALSLRGAHALHFYELLKQYEAIGCRDLTIDDLREKFELQNKYKLFNNLKIRVIEPSIKEINEHTDLSVSYTQITKGRKVIALRFSITNKNKIKKQKNEKEEVSKAKIKPLEVLKIITTNDLLNRFLQHGESTEDLINRIKSDFKNDQSEWWINKLAEFNVDLDA